MRTSFTPEALCFLLYSVAEENKFLLFILFNILIPFTHFTFCCLYTLKSRKQSLQFLVPRLCAEQLRFCVEFVSKMDNVSDNFTIKVLHECLCVNHNFKLPKKTGKENYIMITFYIKSVSCLIQENIISLVYNT